MPENAKPAEKAEDTRAKDQAAAQCEIIAAMVKRVEHANECDGDECTLSSRQIAEGLNMFFDGQEATETEREQYHNEELAREQIEEHPLSVQVRAGWYTPGNTPEKPEEYEILLCTGGPACRIIGDLDQYGQPESAKIQYQDWFTPWEDYREADEAILLSYAQNFYFGD